MSMKNKCAIHFHISEKKFREIIHLFSEDLSVTQISHLTKISRPSINEYLTAIRFRIFKYGSRQLKRLFPKNSKQNFVNILLAIIESKFAFFKV